MENRCCHDTPFLCECCQAHFQIPKRVQNPNLELLRIKEHNVLRVKSEPQPCDDNVDQKTAQKALKKHKRPKTTVNSSRSPNRNYEKKFENQESITEEPSTSKAYAPRKHMERKRMEHYIPEETTFSNTNLRTSPKLAGSLNRPVSKITTESNADATITPRKTQMNELNNKRKKTKVPEISSSVHSQQQRHLKSEENELESRYTYEKPVSEAKEKISRPSLIPVLKRWRTQKVSETVTSNSSQEVEIVEPSTFIESISEYKLLKTSEINTTSNISLSSVERKHSKFEGQRHKVSTIEPNPNNMKTKPPPPIQPKPTSNKYTNLKETQYLLHNESSKDIYEENHKSPQYTSDEMELELSECKITLQSFDLEQTSLHMPQIKQPTLEQAVESLSKTSMSGLTVRSQESGTHSQESELCTCMRSSSDSLERKYEIVESIGVPKFSHDHINIQKVDSKRLLKAQDTSKETEVTTKYCDSSYEHLTQETDSITNQQRCDCTKSIESIPHKTSVKCAFIPIIKSDSVEPNLQQCIPIAQEHPSEVASTEHVIVNVLDLTNNQGGGTETDFSEKMKEYERFRNYRSSTKPNKGRSNPLVISNTDETSNANENSNDSDVSLEIEIERNSLFSDKDDEEKKQLFNESSQLLSDGLLESENGQLTDSLSMIFEQAKRSYKDKKLLEETELSFRLYEYTPIVNGEDDLDEETTTHAVRKTHKTRHAMPSSFKSIEHPITSHSPELSCILETIDSEQFDMENSRSQTHKNQRESIDYKSTRKRRGQEASGATDLNEYRQRSDFDNRFLKPFKYPTCMCEIPIQCQPIIKLLTPRPRTLRSKQTQTLPEAEVSSQNRKEHRTSQSINLEEKTSKKMKQNIPDYYKQPNKQTRDKEFNTENKEQNDESEQRLKSASESIERETLKRRNKKKEDAWAMKNRSSAETRIQRNQGLKNKTEDRFDEYRQDLGEMKSTNSSKRV